MVINMGKLFNRKKRLFQEDLEDEEIDDDIEEDDEDIENDDEEDDVYSAKALDSAKE